MYNNTKQRGPSRSSNYSGGNKSTGSARSNSPSRGGSSFGSRSARPSFGGNRGGGSRSGGGRNKRKSSYERIDVSRFINKSTIIEKEEVYIPTHTFNDFKIDPKLKLAIANKNYIYPSPIQDKSISHSLEGRDILGIADTGTGKTAAFLIPIVNKIIGNKDETAIIIAPTRELAIQIETEFNELVRGMKIYGVVCVGGAPIGAQIRSLKRECNVVIGTPGRLLDLVKRGEINLSGTRSVVLDEADRMLDMGFIDDITFLLEKTPKDRQGFFFSATLPKPIEKLIERFANDPVKVMVKTRETSKNVEQDVIRLERGVDKIDALCDLLDKEDEFKKVLIFSEMKHSVEKLSVELIKRGYKAGSIHGDKRHNDRQRTLLKFRKNEINIMV
ncbi:MAG: DEAD/DEAH box helicase, partial [Candidatus Nomurabacteria bacterium]|nr:DEAD/DEAH box helicase [Candidatus Nomurabacteria bacterium]